MTLNHVQHSIIEPTMAILIKYTGSVFGLWLVTFAISFFGNSSILQNLSLLAGIVLAVVTIASKISNFVYNYREKEIKTKVQQLIKKRNLDEKTERKLTKIVNE